jgi:enoyl-CoA hydratase/carnithine racemase
VTSSIRDRVLLRVEAGVADVRLARADKLNALDADMFAALVEAGETLAADRSVRCVVLSGEGRGFCAGLDLALFEALGSPGQRAGQLGALGGRPQGRPTTLAQQACRVWTDMPAPSIAALHGVALGGGLQLALGADLRIVGPDARLSVLEIRWGFVPDMAGTWALPRLVGLDVAKELTWTGRMVGADEAVRLGLATRVAPDPRAEALALAARIAGSSPDAVQAAKMLLETSATDTFAEHMARETSTLAGLVGTPNQLEAAAAYLERRSPSFTDPSVAPER